MPNSPEATSPSATTQAPVRVATSITALGFRRSIQLSASHSTMRPSASVLRISIVCPLIEVTTSPGRAALPSGMFSAAATTPVTSIGSFRSRQASMTPNTAAAPHMSYFISSSEAEGLIEMPPVSKVMPLPSTTTGETRRWAPRQLIAIRRAGCSLPRVTERKAPMPSSSISDSSTIVHSSRSSSAAIASAVSAR